ncbi:bifunctional protein-serine/threonine kinase/phosphatase [Marinobacteraceae bacterium S3BR75-40.1]
MTQRLHITVGHYSDRGRKPSNQDFHGSLIPREPMLSLKGIALAMADGISSSAVSREASETAIKGFLEDYYCTAEAWSVKTSALRVLNAINAWLYAQTRQSPHRYDTNRGYVCTFSALVLKSNTAHLFHAGDTRIYRLRERSLELLTNDHRLRLSEEESYLSRALGAADHLELDYSAVPLQRGDLFILATDGVYEYIAPDAIGRILHAHPLDLDAAARAIADQAYHNGSDDNLSIQLARIEQLPERAASEIHQQVETLPLPPILEPRQLFDGYRILRELHASSRSHVYLARDEEDHRPVVLKTPSIDLRDDPDYLERLLREEWIARRLSSAHLVKAGAPTGHRRFLYTTLEYVEGQTLAQWIADHPNPELEQVRDIVEQVARGLYALHRKEILHRDLRPENIMIDPAGTVKLIDFGAARVAGLEEAIPDGENTAFPGTALYMAPEYFIGDVGTTRSDLYALGVLTYHMLSGGFPYGLRMARARSAASQRRLRYRSVLDDQRAIPAWVDDTLQKAVHPNPEKRYQELSEFTYDLRHPNPVYLQKTRPPLIERNPVAFWQGISAVLAVIVIVLLYQ